MKFNITNDEVLMSAAAMQQLGEKEPFGDIGLKAARIAKALRVAGAEVQEQRERLIDRHTEKDEDGKLTVKYKPDTKTADRRPDNAEAIEEGGRNIVDMPTLNLALKALSKAKSEIDCPQFTERDIKALNLKPNIIEHLLWNIASATSAPALVPDAKPKRQNTARHAP